MYKFAIWTARTRLLGSVGCLALMIAGAPALAQESQAPAKPAATASADHADPEVVVVYGRATELVGTALSASEGIVGEADLEIRPLQRPGELAEVIPGMVAAQHSGNGKANQYYLRGFNLDHGTDFAASFDGVPLNLIAHPHMSGYLDLNFLIPDVVESVSFQKGTAYAANGDHSAAASADFISHDMPHHSFAELDVTDHDDYRALLLAGRDVGETGQLYGALQYEWGDGYNTRPSELDKYAGFLKYSLDWGDARFHVEWVGYDNDWYATDQMPLRAMQSGLIDRYGTLDPDLGGHTDRNILSAGLTWDDDNSLLVYGESYNFRLFNNPTFYLNDPVRGDEFAQITDRTALGARGKMGRTAQLGGFNVDWRLGSDIRTDFIERDGLSLTEDRQPYQVIRDDNGTVTTADVWADATIHWTDALRTTIGARQDVIWYDFDAVQPENSGSDSDSIFSPKILAAYRFTEAFEAYASYGKSFHTNDPRGGVTTVDPVTGDPVDPSDVFVRSKGGEIGVRYQPSSTFNISLAVFNLDSDSELIFVGDAGTSEPSGATRRYGTEVNAFWRPMDWLAFDASGAWSHSRFKDVPRDEERIPNALDFVGSAGATVTLGEGWEGSARIRYLGESALAEDNSVRSDPSFLMNVGVSKDFGPFYVGLDILNITDSKDNEIEYYYESRLAGETDPVLDRLIHPLEPRTFRLVLRKNF
ncbi:MAG: TonB-dependent receptor [Hyphomonadaceae bacterium]